MLRTLIIDDEVHIQDSLKKLLLRFCPQVSVVGTASGVKSGIDAINEHHPDLVLLDIQMDDGTGFDLLHSFDTIYFKLIIISAFDNNLIQALKLSSVEYLLKPVCAVDLIMAIRNATLMKQGDLLLQLKALDANVLLIS